MTLYSFEQAKNQDRHIIDVDRRVGIPAEHQPLIYNAMKGLETEEILLVTLFFMADLSVEEHALGLIEENLKKIFPPIGLHKLKPEQFHRFRETFITRHLKTNTEWFESPKRGRWINTDEGNKAAINILRKENVVMNLPKNP